MINDNLNGGRRRRVWLFLMLLLLAVLASAAVLVVSGLRSGGSLSLGLPECTVHTAEGEVGLDRDEAKRATTAAALLARGLEAPDTSDIDDAVIQRLTDGPAEDAGPGLACRGSASGGLEEQQLGASGLTPRAEQVLEAMTGVFGKQSLGGYAPGGVSQGHGAASTHYDGRAIDIFFRPVSEDNRRDGWMLAHWLVAHAEDLDIQYVIFDDRFWSAHLTRAQWHDYDAPDPSNEILRHLDHVHVDVLGGGD